MKIFILNLLKPKFIQEYFPENHFQLSQLVLKIFKF